MAEQGSYPLNGRTLSSTDTVTGVVAGQTADIPLSSIQTLFNTGGVFSGPTSNRPAPTLIGQGYFDTDLGYMVWASKIFPPIWVTASGVAV